MKWDRNPATSIKESDTPQLSMLPPHLPRGMRNRLVHEYWRVDRDIVWATVTTDLPALRDDIEGVLA